jgi:hypothetical protein
MHLELDTESLIETVNGSTYDGEIKISTLILSDDLALKSQNLLYHKREKSKYIR